MDQAFYQTVMTWNDSSFQAIFQMVKEDYQILRSLYAYNSIFSKFINTLFKRRKENQEYSMVLETTMNFLSCNLIKTPEDILMCLKYITNKADRIECTKRIIRNHLISNDVLISLAINADVFQKLPYDLSWIEVPILKYGIAILSLNLKELSIKQICPLFEYIDDKSLIEYLLGWAFEENKLDKNGVAYFKTHFPKKHEMLMRLNNI